MQTKYPLFLVMAIAGATLIWVGSGMGATYGVGDPIGSDSPAADEIEGQAANASVSENGSFDASSKRTAGDSGLVGIIVTGSQFVVSLGQIVLFLPAQLQQLGLPGYVAGPIGLLSQMMVALGVVQFLANRRYD